jgi:Ankyrin repeats (many copies)
MGNFLGANGAAHGGLRNRPACLRLLLERGADIDIRDHGDNAYALHFAADCADFERRPRAHRSRRA